jgi:hypothetical protein
MTKFSIAGLCLGYAVLLGCSTSPRSPSVGPQDRPVKALETTSFQGLPPKTAEAIRQDMAQRLLTQPQAVALTQVEPRNWNMCSNGGPSLSPIGNCPNVEISGWQVTAVGSGQRWIYFADSSASVTLDGPRSLPDTLANAAIDAAALRGSGASRDTFSLYWAEQKLWGNACFDIADPAISCAAVQTPGWEITIVGDNKQWIYRAPLQEGNQAVQLVSVSSMGAQVQ